MKMCLDKILIIFIKKSYGEVYRHEYSNCVATSCSTLFAFCVEICIGQNFVKDIFISEIISKWHGGGCRHKFPDFVTL
jgi:hypothetical protein